MESVMPRPVAIFIHPECQLSGFDKDTQPHHVIEDHWTMAHVLHKASSFNSVGQARRAGWNIPIPDGVTIETVGKMKRLVLIVNLGKE
tara:strand:- start:481 stop:744 length:264 start_codon:yes stop_codon:yes gene_type:complete